MENHRHHHQYGFSELRQLMNNGGRLTSPPSSSSHFPTATIPSDLFGFNLAPAQPHHHHQYQEVNFVPRGGLHGFFGDSSAATNNAMASSSGTSGAASGGGAAAFGGLLDGGDGGYFGVGDSGGNGRWPRQETLTLLEIRSRLDYKFKEANQKGPLWDEVSRIMSEEHGYQRSGKKCREKFENLYKYYKKTKEGKAGRQDGKHYRFFRQLEAIYGDSSNSVSCPETVFISNNLHFHASTNNTNTLQNISDQELLNTNANLHHGDHPKPISTDYNSLSLSNFNSSDLDTSPSKGNDSSRRKRRNWKVKIKEFIDAQMKKLIEKQEAWLDKLTKMIEEKEQERMLREEEWRKQEAARIDKERSFWAKEREWIEARDAALLEALQNLTGRQLVKASSSSHEEIVGNENRIENGRKRKEKQNLLRNSGGYFPRLIDDNNSVYSQGNGYNGDHQLNEQGRIGSIQPNHNEGSSHSNSNAGNAMSSFPFLIGDGDQNLWDSYSLRLSKGENQ